MYLLPLQYLYVHLPVHRLHYMPDPVLLQFLFQLPVSVLLPLPLDVPLLSAVPPTLLPALVPHSLYQPSSSVFLESPLAAVLLPVLSPVVAAPVPVLAELIPSEQVLSEPEFPVTLFPQLYCSRCHPQHSVLLRSEPLLLLPLQYQMQM